MRATEDRRRIWGPSPRYTAEFKQKAVELYKKSGTTYAEVARGLGCDARGLSDWVKKADAADCGAGDDPFRMAEDLRRLKRRRRRHGAVRRHRLPEDPAGPAAPGAGDGHIVEADRRLGHLQGITAELADEALKMAPARRNDPRGCVHHSGHGAQYASLPPSKIVRERGARPSMGSISSPWGNAAMEPLMGIVKSECVRAGLRRARGGRAGHLRVHRGGVQPGEDPLGAGLHEPGRV